MVSTYTNNYGIEKMGVGDQSGAWGTTANYNLDILDRVASYKTIALADAATATLTVREASPDTGADNVQDGMYRLIKYTGTLSQNCTITIAPNTTGVYFIFINGTTGGFSLIFSQGSGDNYTLAPGGSAVVYGDGAGAAAAVAAASVDPLTTRGDILVRDASNLSARLAAGSANQALLSDGTDISYGQVDLTAGVTGTLPVANGGLGATTLSDGGILLGSGTDPVTAMGALAKGSVVAGDGSTDPQALPVGDDTQILTADSSETLGVKWAAAGGGGAWSYISGVTVTEVANIDFTGLNGDYEVYMFQFGGVMAVNFAPYLRWYFGTGAGPTWATTKYSYVIDITMSGSTSYVQENDRALRQVSQPMVHIHIMDTCI